jgi:hypothetical protein
VPKSLSNLHGVSVTVVKEPKGLQEYTKGITHFFCNDSVWGSNDATSINENQTINQSNKQSKQSNQLINQSIKQSTLLVESRVKIIFYS